MQWEDRIANINALNRSALISNVPINTVKLARQFRLYLERDRNILDGEEGGIILEGNELVFLGNPDFVEKLGRIISEFGVEAKLEGSNYRVDRDRFVERFNFTCQKIGDRFFATSLLKRFSAMFPSYGLLAEPVEKLYIRGSELIIVLNTINEKSAEIVHDALLKMGITEIREVQLGINGLPVTKRTKKDFSVNKDEFYEELKRLESVSKVLHDRIMQVLDLTSDFDVEIKVLYFNDRTVIDIKPQTPLEEDSRVGILRRLLEATLKAIAPEIKVDYNANNRPYISCSVDSDTLLKGLKINPQYINYEEGTAVAK